MIVAAVFAAAVAGLSGRPADLAPDPAAYSAWLAAKAAEFDAQLAGAPCPTATVRSRGGRPGGAAPFNAPAPDGIVSDGFYEFLELEGCGRIRKPNLYVVRLTSGWRTVGMLYGDSNADLRLLFDTLPLAQAFLLQAAGCQDPTSLRIEEASILRAPAGPGGSWEELWPAVACGKSVSVKVIFTPNAAGTRYEVVPVPPA